MPPRFDPADLSGLDEGEAAELEQARGRLRSCVRAYAGVGDPVPVKKVFRVATARFLQAVDHVLKEMTGHGMERFISAGTKIECVKEGHRADLARWMAEPGRSLTVAADQQSWRLLVARSSG